MAKSKVKVIDRGWNEILKNIGTLNNSSVKVGFPTGGKIGNPLNKGSGHDLYNTIPDVATVAFNNEFGTDKIPERPFMRRAFTEVFPALLRLRNNLYKKVTAGTMGAEQALGLLGEKLVAETRRQIRNIKTPANSQETIDRKGSSNPLIDSGQMIQSVQKKVELGGGAPLKTGIKVAR